MSYEAKVNKFRDCVSNSVKLLSDETIDKIIKSVSNLEETDDIADIIRLVT
jgi:hypothetical protein